MPYKVLSALTAFGMCGFLLGFSLAFTGNLPYGDEPGGVTLGMILAISITLMAGGLIAMIAHLNLSSRPTADEKAEWRRFLGFGGPVAAAAYLWRVAGRRPKPSDSEDPWYTN